MFDVLGTSVGSSVGTPPARAMRADASYWLAMFAASALGTNLGDYWNHGLGGGLVSAFATMAALSAAAMFWDRRAGAWGEGGYWVAVVALRAAATNAGDFLAFGIGLPAGAAALVLGALTLFAGRVTRPGGPTPLVDSRYWGAMLVAGVFGTVAGDWAGHAIGLYAAAGLLSLALLLTLAGFARGAGGLMGYWVVVLAERAAGTPVGDMLASRRAMALGLPLAMLVTGGTLAAVLWWRLGRRAVADARLG